MNSNFNSSTLKKSSVKDLYIICKTYSLVLIWIILNIIASSTLIYLFFILFIRVLLLVFYEAERKTQLKYKTNQITDNNFETLEENLNKYNINNHRNTNMFFIALKSLFSLKKTEFVKSNNLFNLIYLYEQWFIYNAINENKILINPNYLEKIPEKILYFETDEDFLIKLNDFYKNFNSIKLNEPIYFQKEIKEIFKKYCVKIENSHNLSSLNYINYIDYNKYKATNEFEIITISSINQDKEIFLLVKKYRYPIEQTYPIKADIAFNQNLKTSIITKIIIFFLASLFLLFGVQPLLKSLLVTVFLKIFKKKDLLKHIIKNIFLLTAPLFFSILSNFLISYLMNISNFSFDYFFKKRFWLYFLRLALNLLLWNLSHESSGYKYDFFIKNILFFLSSYFMYSFIFFNSCGFLIENLDLQKENHEKKKLNISFYCNLEKNIEYCSKYPSNNYMKIWSFTYNNNLIYSILLFIFSIIYLKEFEFNFIKTNFFL